MTKCLFFSLVVTIALVVCACAKSPSGGGSQGSSSSSNGGGTPCPADPQAAVGKSCAPDGATCGTSPSGFTHFIMCQNGKWGEMEAPPPPPPTPTSS